jgi:SAM-dependent methyltransferase
LNYNSNSNSSLPLGWFDGVVSPATLEKLSYRDGVLQSKSSKEKFKVDGELVDLLVPELQNKSLIDELEAMDSLPVYGVSYFKEQFIESVTRELYGLLSSPAGSQVNIVEIGGGDGQFARHFLKYDQTRVFIGDICQKFLELAPDGIRKIRCDMCHPFYEENGLDLAVFWVSLHHLTEPDQIKALKVALASLKPNGLLVFFEPNAFFFPRQILLKTFLKNHVYFDDEEKPIDYLKIREDLCVLGMKEVCTRFIQPPYALKFLKKLKYWPFYFIGVGLLYWLDRFLLLPFGKFIFGSGYWFEKIRKYSASYFLAVYRKV